MCALHVAWMDVCRGSFGDKGDILPLSLIAAPAHLSEASLWSTNTWSGVSSFKTTTRIQPPFWLLDSLVSFTVPLGWLRSHPWLFPSSKTYWIAKPQIRFHWQFIGALCSASYHHFLLEMSPPGASASLNPSCLPWLLADSFWPVLPPWTWREWASSTYTVSLG